MPGSDQRLDDREAYAFLAGLFPGGLFDVALMAEVCPEGWRASPLFACFHPSLERSYEEYLWSHENLKRLTAGIAKRRDRAAGKCEDDDENEDDPPLNLETYTVEWRKRDAERQPKDADDELEEFAELVGLCLWDIFSDNHDVLDGDGRLVDLGSFRGSASTIADFFHSGHKQNGYPPPSPGDWILQDRDYIRFYMGSINIAGRADLSPVYRLIFARIKAVGGDWRYSFPRIGMVSFRKSKADALRADAGNYDPSVVLAAEEEDAEHEAKLADMQRNLDESAARAKRQARQGPPPATVSAYRSVFKRFPKGWPPEL